jgi:hypothetical protein
VSFDLQAAAAAAADDDDEEQALTWVMMSREN